MKNVNAQVNLERDKAIDAIQLLKHDWNFFEFQIKMLKLQIADAKNVIQRKDEEISDLMRIQQRYKEYAKAVKGKWWQSPFLDVIFFVGGIVLGTIIVVNVKFI